MVVSTLGVVPVLDTGTYSRRQLAETWIGFQDQVPE